MTNKKTTDEAWEEFELQALNLWRTLVDTLMFEVEDRYTRVRTFLRTVRDSFTK